jgi:hypothetical protein
MVLQYPQFAPSRRLLRLQSLDTATPLLALIPAEIIIELHISTPDWRFQVPSRGFRALDRDLLSHLQP